MPTSREERAARSRQIAARIRAYVEERARDEPDFTMRKLSLACGWDGSHLSTVVRRLEDGRDVRMETLRTVAKTMGRPQSWLETGRMPEGHLLSELPDWDELAEEAVERCRANPAAVAALGRHRVPELPKSMNAHLLALIAKAWDDAS